MNIESILEMGTAVIQLIWTGWQMYQSIKNRRSKPNQNTPKSITDNGENEIK